VPMRSGNINENVTLPHTTPATAAITDPSAPVREFLQSLNPDLEHRLDQFVALGIKDHLSLLAFKSWPTPRRDLLLSMSEGPGKLEPLERVAVGNYFWK